MGCYICRACVSTGCLSLGCNSAASWPRLEPWRRANHHAYVAEGCSIRHCHLWTSSYLCRGSDQAMNLFPDHCFSVLQTATHHQGAVLPAPTSLPSHPVALLRRPLPNPPLQRDATPAGRLRAPELARCALYLAKGVEPNIRKSCTNVVLGHFNRER